MQLKTLSTTHPSYDKDRWNELDALAKGGKRFHSRLSRFLPQNAVEPVGLYQQRCAQAHYTSYVGAIINSYVSWLFTASLDVKPVKRGTSTALVPDQFYTDFREDIGDETTLENFMRERAREALTSGKSYWLAELPSDEGAAPGDKAEWSKRGLGRATLRPVDRCAVLDWAEDDLGTLEWAVVYSCEAVRKTWQADRDTVVECWRVYDRENVTTFEIEHPASQRLGPDTDVPLKVAATGPHGFKRCPLLKMEVPIEVCIGEQTRDPQVEHFRLDNALSWLSRRTCYAQPLFQLTDPDETIPTMGAGYAVVIGADDKFGWTNPPVAPFDVLGKMVEAKRDEIYRVTQTLAQAVNNNAETVGRSADSKEIDAAATRIMLQAYGTYVSASVEETMELISEARGELDYEWSVEGFSGYDTASVASLIANVQQARDLGIPSKTLHKKLANKVASALLAGESERLKETIQAEIDSADYDVSSLSKDEKMQDKQLEATKEADTLKAKTVVKAAAVKPPPAAPSADID